MNTIKTRGISYLRVSGEGQLSGHGFQRQRESILKYAKQHNIEMVAEYRDRVSGTKELTDRQGLASLLDRLESNGIQVVLVERADRIARDLLISEIILNQFRDLGVSVIAADGGGELTVGDDDPTRTLIRQVLGAVSQFEKSVIVLKLRSARDRKRKLTGRCEGRKPFPNNPAEMKTFTRMKQLRRKPRNRPPLSFAKIARCLNDEGYATRQGGPWKAGTVQAILRRRNRQS